MSPPAVILFPSHGCQPAGQLTKKQQDEHLVTQRQAIRQHWEHAGVKAIVQLIERRAAMKQRAAVQPGAAPHDQGQAFALDELITVLNGIQSSVEESQAVE